jgi:hypothetical protein
MIEALRGDDEAGIGSVLAQKLNDAYLNQDRPAGQVIIRADAQAASMFFRAFLAFPGRWPAKVSGLSAEDGSLCGFGELAAQGTNAREGVHLA